MRGRRRMWTVRMTVIRGEGRGGGGGRAAREWMRGKGGERPPWGGQWRARVPILIMESVQVKRSIFPPAHVYPRFPPRSLFPPSSLLRFGFPRSSLFTPVVWTCEALRFQFRAISLLSSPSSADHRPPSGWSLFNIDFLSKGRKYREYRVTRAALATVKPRRLFYTLRGQRWREGRKGCANVHEMFAIASCIVRVTTIILRNKYFYQQYILL